MLYQLTLASRSVTKNVTALNQRIAQNQTQKFSKREMVVREHAKKPTQQRYARHGVRPQNRQAYRSLTEQSQLKKNSGT